MLFGKKKTSEKRQGHLWVVFFLAVFLFPSAAFSDCWFATKYTIRDSQSKWLSADPRIQIKNKTEAGTCQKRLAETGFGSVIEQVWGGDARLGKAITCHENGARPSSDPGAPAVCGFQIHEAAGYAQLAAKLEVCSSKTAGCGQQFKELINRDPVMCARAGYQVFSDFKEHYGSQDLALCSYGGGDFRKQYRYCGYCAPEVEFKAIAQYMDGQDIPTTVQTDINKDGYSNVQITVDGKQITVFNCQDKSGELAKGIANAMKGYQYAAVSASDEMFKTVLDSQAKSTATKYRDLDKYCIKGISKFFDLIRNILSGIDGIIQMIKSLIQSILNEVCTVVASSINSLLSSLCLPIPDLSFGLSLGTSTESCSGLSLATLLSVSSGSPDLSQYLSGSKSDTLKPVDGLETTRAGGVNLPGWFQRKLNSSKSETLFQY